MTQTVTAAPLLEVSDLSIGFETNRGIVRPVQHVSFTIFPGQTVALVGESGCGKSVTAMSILRLIPQPPGLVLGGRVLLEGRDLLTLPERQMRAVRGKQIAMIFQEPMTSLNPVYTIGDQIAEAVVLHQAVSSRKAYEIAEDALHDVGISDPRRRIREYPHQMSGGMRQRVMIAMALSCQPKLLIADEPTTALDVTIQAQILELLRKLQRERGMSILLITHDLGVVAENADVVGVMYASRIVEFATVEDLFDHPQHPYTEGLFRSVPKLGSTVDRLDTIAGAVPNPARFPSGCKFHPRCPRTRQQAAGLPPEQAVEIAAGAERFNISRVCTEDEPALKELSPGHWGFMSFHDRIFGSAGDSSAIESSSGSRRGGRCFGDDFMTSGLMPSAGQVSVPASNQPLLEVRDLRTWFPIRRGLLSTVAGHVKAVDGVSFDVFPGRTLGLVGESGCGKTTVGRTILRLIPATSGTIRFKDHDFLAYRGEALRHLRRQMQIVFQDPVSSLNPRMTVGSIIGEPLEVHGIARGREKTDRVAELLQRVGLDPTYSTRYPHEFSGGQRQRVGIARALALSPDFIVCDEPVSALDVSIQSQILNLLDDLQREMKIAYLFIAHNLAVVEHFSDEVAVMYLGRIVEKAESRELYANPKHPYTVSLLSAVPEPDPRPKRKRIVLPGEVPSPSNPPSGCPFHPRCPLTRQLAGQATAAETIEIISAETTTRVMSKCVTQIPPLEPKKSSSGHSAACWFAE